MHVKFIAAPARFVSFASFGSLVLVALTLSSPAHAEAAPDTQPDQAQPKPRAPVEVGALGGVGFPRPLSIEGLVRFDRVALFGLEYGVLPKVSIGGVDTSSTAVSADLRVFPTRGAFFVGLRGGHQSITASTTVSALGISADESLTLDTWFINPRLGFLWTWEPGIALAMEAGVQIPVSSSSSTSVPSVYSLDSRVTNAADSFGKSILPTIDLLRIGVVL
jgi:hypothetical protein